MSPNILPMNFNQLDKLLIEPEKDYHSKAGECLSSHLLGTFRRCPLMYFLTVMGKYKRPDSHAYALGSVAHCFILEGEDQYHKAYNSDSPINMTTGKPYGNTTKKYTEWAAVVVASGSLPISLADESLAFKLRDSVNRHSLASSLLESAPYRERVIRVTAHGMGCQSRMDAFGADFGIVDLKTCQDLDKLIYQARSFGYVEQLAFYRMVARKAGFNVPKVYLIGVEKQFPYRCGVWQIEESSLDFAEQNIVKDIKSVLDCTRNNTWPTGYEELRLMEF